MAQDTVRPVLHIGAQQTLVRAAAVEDPQGLPLAIGSHRTTADFFRHSPPFPGELEAAIMMVEDELSRVPALASNEATVLVPAAFMEELRRSAGAVDWAVNSLSLDQVEHLFDLLAALSLGRPAASAGISGAPEFAATLLILRECMHHLKFDAVWLEASI